MLEKAQSVFGVDIYDITDVLTSCLASLAVHCGISPSCSILYLCALSLGVQRHIMIISRLSMAAANPAQNLLIAP
jgi:hypothetical protein